MKALLLILVVGLYHFTYSQTNSENITEKKGFIFGTAVGASYISLRTTNLPNHQELSLSLPNIKFGFMVNRKLACA